MPLNGRTDKESVAVYTLEYYSVVKNNDILNFVCKWMELENTILSEITQSQIYEYGINSFWKGRGKRGGSENLDW